MCRILAARIESPGGLKLLESLLPAFHKASSMDDRLKRIGASDPRHCHGYGYILLTNHGGAWRLYFRRVDTAPRYGLRDSCKENLSRLKGEIPVIASRLKGAGRAYLILHSRRASKASIRGSRAAHPFHVKGVNRGRIVNLYLAHNGSVSQEELEDDLGLTPGVYVDSYVLAMWIAKRIERGLKPEEALAEGMDYTKSAYIVAMLTLMEEGPTLYYAAYLPPKTGEEKRKYYQPHLVEAPGARILASPTVFDYANSVDSRPVELSRRVYTL